MTIDKYENEYGPPGGQSVTHVTIVYIKIIDLFPTNKARQAIPVRYCNDVTLQGTRISKRRQETN